MRSRLISLAIPLLLIACGPISSPQRPFSEAFPDPSILLTTTDYTAMRERIKVTILPKTDEHHRMLEELLASVDEIDAGNLVLLADSVALASTYTDHLEIDPAKAENPTGAKSISISVAGGRVVQRIYPPRGESTYSATLDRILTAGVAKLHDVDPHFAGVLIGKTQSRETLRLLAAELLPEVDDGSPAALRSILQGIESADVRLELVVDVLLPGRGLTPEREVVAFEELSFDATRIKFADALVEPLREVEADRMIRWLRCFSFDASRGDLLELVSPIVTAVTGSVVADAMGAMSFDPGRTSAAKLLMPLASLDGRDGIAMVDTLSFDEARVALAELLAQQASWMPTTAEAAELIRTASFDAGRTKILEAISPRLRPPHDGPSLHQIVAAFSFDAGRLSAVKELSQPIGALDEDEQKAILALFKFASGRDEAAQLLVE